MPEQLPDLTHVVEPGGSSAASPSGGQPKPDAYLDQIIDGKYRVISKLGAGGMGAVYKAEHSLMGRLVALKVLHPHLIENEELMKRFQHEARIASKLNHPNAITTYDFGIYQGAPYLAMEYVEGRTLNDLIAKTGPIPIARIINIYLQICSALAKAHQLGIVHRDLKPDNIMLVPQPGGSETAILLDFGIAKMLSQHSEQTRTVMTQAGMFYGTPKYASPEQALEKTLDKRSDIYTLGIILYEALSGEVPFEAPSVMEVLMKQLNQDPVPLSKFKPELKIPEAVDELIMKCLRKNPDERFQSVEEFLQELKVIDASRSLRRGFGKGIVRGGAAALVIAGGIFAWTKLHGTPAPSQQPPTTATKVEKKTEPVALQAVVTPAPPADTSLKPEKEPLRDLAQMLLRSVETGSTKKEPAEETTHAAQATPESLEVAAVPPVSEATVEILNPPSDMNAIQARNDVTVPEVPPPPAPVNVQPPPLPIDQSTITDAMRKDLSKIDAGKKEAAKFYSEGRDLYRQRRYADAAAKFELAIQYRADAIGSFISLGNCYMKLGKRDQALSAFLTALRIEPSYGPAHYSLAGYYAAQGDSTKALEFLRRAIQRDPRAKNFATEDPDFASIRDSAEFKAIVR